MLIIKILSLGAPERYSLHRLVNSVLHDLQLTNTQQAATISEVGNADEIGRYASFLVMPTLVINEIVVCSGRFPTRQEVAGWLLQANNDPPDQMT